MSRLPVIRAWAWVWAFGACALTVLALALLPTVPHMITTGWDKSNHVLAFAVLAWLGGRAFPPGVVPRWSGATPRRFASGVVRVLLGLVFFGALIEVLQSFTPTRSAEWGDLFADCVGVLTGWVLLRLQGRVAEKPAAPLAGK